MRLRGGDRLLVVNVSEKVREIMLAAYSPTVFAAGEQGNPATCFYDTSITTCNITAHLRSHSHYVGRAVNNIAAHNAASAGVDTLV